jgi:hypothetical protein
MTKVYKFLNSERNNFTSTVVKRGLLPSGNINFKGLRTKCPRKYLDLREVKAELYRSAGVSVVTSRSFR